MVHKNIITLLLLVFTTVAFSQSPPRIRLIQIEQSDSIGRFPVSNQYGNLEYNTSLMFKDGKILISGAAVLTENDTLRIYLNTEIPEVMRSNLLFIDSSTLDGRGTIDNPLKLKQNTLVNGGVPFGSSGILAQDASNLYWDNTNKRLGLGTSSPTQTLDVNGALRLRNKSSADSVLGGEIYWSSTYNTFYGIDTSGSAFVLGGTCTTGGENTSLSGTALFSPNGNNYIAGDGGLVGIGTTNPQYRLDVDGRTFTDTLTYTVLTSPSDIRLKKDIRPYPSVLNKMNSLNVVTFQWNENIDDITENMQGQASSGLIAQQVESLFPEYINTMAKNYKGIDYIGFITPLIKSVQELSDKVEENENKIKQIQDIINIIEKEIQDIKSK